jgi:hypothetical protein
MKKTENISMTWEVSTISHDCHKPVTVLLLHGFMQTADRFVSQVKSVLEEKANRLHCFASTFSCLQAIA